jgi:hypothetical protein
MIFMAGRSARKSLCTPFCTPAFGNGGLQTQIRCQSGHKCSEAYPRVGAVGARVGPLVGRELGLLMNQSQEMESTLFQRNMMDVASVSSNQLRLHQRATITAFQMHGI